MVIFFDTETTSLRPGRICQLSYIMQEEESVSAKNMFFDVGWVDPSAAAVHGFTADVLKELSRGQIFADRLEEIKADFSRADVIAAHNFAFDFMFMRAEFEREGERFTYKNSLCSMKKFTPICKLLCSRGAGWKYPKLTELCEFLEIYPYDITRASIALFGAAPAAHDARYDTSALWLALSHGGRDYAEIGEALKAR